MPISRLFCVTVYVFNADGTKCLMLDHRKLKKWMPPGGKIDPNELPDHAAIRETFEETGVKITLLGQRSSVPTGLMRPEGIQLSEVIPGKLEHIDLIYYAQVIGDATPVLNEQESTDVRWFAIEEVLEPSFNTFEDVKVWTRQLADKILDSPSRDVVKEDMFNVVRSSS